MSFLTPSWMDAASGYSGSDDRRMLSAALQPGVVDAASLAVTQRAAGANLSVDVAAGTAFAPQGQGTEALKRGWVCTSTAVENLAISAAPGVGGQSRKDLVVVQVRDDTVDAGGFNDWYLRVVQGTAGTPGAAPATPDHAYVLAVVTLTNGDTSVTTSNISDSRTTNISRALSGNSKGAAGSDVLRHVTASQRMDLVLSSNNNQGLGLGTDNGLFSESFSALQRSAYGPGMIANAGQTADGYYFAPNGPTQDSNNNSGLLLSNAVAWPIMVAKTCTLATMSMYNSAAASSTIYFQLYANGSNNRPGTKIADLGSISHGAVAATDTLTIGSPPTLTAGVVYWLSAIYTGGGGHSWRGPGKGSGVFSYATVAEATVTISTVVGTSAVDTDRDAYQTTNNAWSGITTSGPTSWANGQTVRPVWSDPGNSAGPPYALYRLNNV